MNENRNDLADGGVAALLLLAAVGALVWAGGVLAALLSGHVPPAPAGIDRVLLVLPSELSDPRRAWPPDANRSLPGPVLYWSAQGLVVLASAAIVMIASRARRGRGRRGSLGFAVSAGLGRRRDLRRLAVRRAAPGRLVIGRVGSQLLAAERQASVAVVGPTGCGKTAGFVIPALLEWAGPVLATSVKGDALHVTLAHRAARGRVWVYDPTGASRARPSGWSPLASCRSWSGAQRVAAWLAEAASPRSQSLADADYWFTQARKALAPYLHAAALDNRSMAGVVRWVDGEEVDEVADILANAQAQPSFDDLDFDGFPLADGRAALVSAMSLWRKEERLRSSILATVENVVSGYADSRVAALDADADIDLEEWLSGDNTIYVVSSAHDQARLRPVFAVLVAEAIRRAFDRANAVGGTLARPCLAMLDEAGTMAPVAELPTWAATARSHGISLVTVWQDLAQIRSRYGESASTLLNNHPAKVFGSGIADQVTLDYLSAMVGEERVTEHTWSREMSAGRRTVADHVSWQRAAPPEAIRRLDPTDALLIYGSEAPARVRLRPWYRDRTLRRLAGGDAVLNTTDGRT